MKLHCKERNGLKETLTSVPGNICLTSDLWTSIATDSYLALTAHYVDEHWTSQKRVLNLRHIPQPHTGPELAIEIINLLRDWGIEKKIFTLTLDNASYNDGLVDVLKRQFRLNGSAICNGDFLHVRCGAHILNLIVRAGLDIIEEPVRKIRECVKYVRSSEARKLKFARCIVDASLGCTKKVIQDVATRWNSTYLMLDSALHFRRAFEQLRNVDAIFTYCPTEVEWEKVRKIAKFLKPFFSITTMFSGSEYPTSNIYFHGVWKIEESLCIAMASSDKEICEMTFDMHSKFEKYWKDYCQILCFGVILDPRFKLAYIKYCFLKLHDKDVTEEKLSTIHNSFKDLFGYYLRRSSTTSFSSPQALMFGNSINVDDDEIDDFARFESEQNASRRSQSELDAYLEATSLPATQELNILKYWKENSERYPTLAIMAEDILSIPLTTVASESTFSIGGRVIGKFRSSLSPETAEALVCTRDWLFGLEAVQEDEDSFFDFAPLVAQFDFTLIN